MPLRKNKWSSKKWVSYLKSFLILLISTLVLGILGKPLKGKLYLGDSKTNIKKPF